MSSISYPAKRSSDLTEDSAGLRSYWCSWSLRIWCNWSLTRQRICVSGSFCDKFYDSFYDLLQNPFRLWSCWSNWSSWGDRDLCSCNRFCLYWRNRYLCLWRLWCLWRCLYRSSGISYEIVWVSRRLCRDLCLCRIHFYVLFIRLNII